MRRVEIEISADQYDELIKMSPAEQRKELEKGVRMEWRLDYGYYGSHLAAIGNRFYIVHTIGDSCD